MKKCSVCKQLYNINEITKYSKNRIGTQYYICCNCNKERVRIYRETENGRKKINQCVYRSGKKHKEKKNCRQRFHYHLRKGHITRFNNCEVCNKECKPDAHHEDYTKALSIRWLCRKCHKLLHKK